MSSILPALHGRADGPPTIPCSTPLARAQDAVARLEAAVWIHPRDLALLG